MQTMYDKLGELLSETLEAGEIKFVRVERPLHADPASSKQKTDGAEASAEASNEDSAAEPGDASSGAEKAGSANSSTAKSAKSGERRAGSQRRAGARKKPVANNSYFYKKITPELERAYRLLGLGFQANLEDAKKAYKEKLKYYHPDRYAGNEVLTKVATDKTRQIVESFAMITEFLTK